MRPANEFDAPAYWERRLERFDLGAVGHSGFGLSYNRWLYRVRAFAFRRMLRETRIDPALARILDVGSGTGFYLDQWLRAGAVDVVGSDLTNAATKRLERLYPGLQITKFDISEQPPFAPESFDLISAFDVLFHIVDDSRYESALRNISALLREDGIFLLSESLVHGQEIRIEHQVSRRLDDIEQLLLGVGFEVVRRRPIFALMNTPVDSNSSLLQRFSHELQRLVQRSELLGAVVGGLLFPLELLLVSILREGPSTDLMVCRNTRRARAATPSGCGGER